MELKDNETRLRDATVACVSMIIVTILCLACLFVILIAIMTVYTVKMCDGLQSRIYNPIIYIIDNKVAWQYNHTSIGIIFKWWPEKYLNIPYDTNIFTLDVKGLVNVAYARYTIHLDSICLSMWSDLSQQ